MQRQARITLLLLAAGLCLWGSVAGVPVIQAAGQAPATVAILSGGGFRLTTFTWQAAPVAQGQRYILLAPEVRPAETTLTGNGCCCIYYPCIRR